MKFVSFTAVLVICGFSPGATIEVPGDFSSIQEALANCQTTDTVLVSPGTYTENIVWPDIADLVLISEMGPAQTIIDGDSSGTVIALLSAVVDTSTVIEGFTIRNGAADQGGGIRCSLSSPLITGNIIEDCFAVFDGGGLYCVNSSVIIDDNIIRDNSVGIPISSDGSSKDLTTGGGIRLAGTGAGAVISNNTISDNYCTYYGGGLASSRDALITGNHIINNISDWFGGGFYHLNASGTVLRENLISGNSSNWGGGIMLQGGHLTISRCDILDNEGDGLHIYYGSLTADSSAFLRNTGDGIGTGGGKGSGSRGVSVHHCNIVDNDGFGIRSSNSWLTFDATLNWWGDASGPGGVGPGSGDEVSIYVEYDPWLTYTGISEESGGSPSGTPFFAHLPNPVRSSTTLILEGGGRAGVRVLDLSGREVASLYDGVLSGPRSIRWDPSGLTTGMYFICIIQGDDVSSARVTIIR